MMRCVAGIPPFVGGLLPLLVAGVAPATAMEPGEYRGNGEGAKLAISVRGSEAEVTLTGKGCLGGLSGPVKKAGTKRWTITMSEYGNTCTLGVRQQGDRYNVREGGGACYTFHGMSCGFSGYVKRVK